MPILVDDSGRTLDITEEESMAVYGSKKEATAVPACSGGGQELPSLRNLADSLLKLRAEVDEMHRQIHWLKEQVKVIKGM